MMAGMGIEVLRLHSYEEFQLWLARNEDRREELEELMGVDLGVDGHSLDVLEAFLLARYRTADEALRLDERGVLDAASRHIGLVLVLNVDDAEWGINLDDDERAYYRLPLIRFGKGHEVCPLTMAMAALSRRTGDFLHGLLEGYEEHYNGATPG